MDKLERIFELQAELNEHLGVKPNMGFMLNLVRATQQELSELTDEFPWKWWGHHKDFNKALATEELMDVVHFVVMMCQAMGLTPSDILTNYEKKNRKNRTRWTGQK